MNTFFFASLLLYSSFLWWCISLDKNMCSKIGFLYNLFEIKRDTLTIWTKIYQISNAVFHFNERKGIKMICMFCLGCSAIFLVIVIRKMTFPSVKLIIKINILMNDWTQSHFNSIGLFYCLEILYISKGFVLIKF